MSDTMTALVKYAPFGVFCLIFLHIQHRSHSKALDRMEKAFDKALSVIQENQKESLKILKDAQNISITKKMKEK